MSEAARHEPCPPPRAGASDLAADGSAVEGSALEAEPDTSLPVSGDREPDVAEDEPPYAQGKARPDASLDRRADPVLPDAVRRRVLDTAAGVLGSLPPGEVPPLLARVRSFAPARRAERGAIPLLAALERDDVFRARVATAVRTETPDLADGVDAGFAPPDADAADVAAAAYLLRPPGWQELLDTAGRVLTALDRSSHHRR